MALRSPAPRRAAPRSLRWRQRRKRRRKGGGEGARRRQSAAAARPASAGAGGGGERTGRQRRGRRSYRAAYAYVRWTRHSLLQYQTKIPPSLHCWQQHNRLPEAVSLAAQAAHSRRNLLILAALALAVLCPPQGLVCLKESISLPVESYRSKLALGTSNSPILPSQTHPRAHHLL